MSGDLSSSKLVANPVDAYHLVLYTIYLNKSLCVFSFLFCTYSICFFVGGYLVETPHHRLGRGGAGPRSRIQLQPQ